VNHGRENEKNGVLYERGILGDRKIGDIKADPVGKYIVEKGLGGKFIDIKETPFGEKIQATTDWDWFNNLQKGFRIEKTIDGDRSSEWEEPGEFQNNLSDIF
jgi:hypothetical protein